MKSTTSTLTACFVFCHLVWAQSNASGLFSEIVGAWQPGERLISQPPPEMWQDIKEITFHANGIVEWSESKQGRMVEISGQYMIQPDNLSKRNLPAIFVIPKNQSAPALSSACLLRLSEVEIDFDSRFPAERFGKALKAVTANGKRVVFIRMKKATTQALQDIVNEAPPERLVSQSTIKK
jgi:hypothetical protein